MLDDNSILFQITIRMKSETVINPDYPKPHALCSCLADWPLKSTRYYLWSQGYN